MWGYSLEHSEPIRSYLPEENQYWFPQQPSTANSFQIKGGSSQTSSPSMLECWLLLFGSGKHSCYEFMSDMIVSYPEDIVSQQSSQNLVLPFHILSLFSPISSILERTEIPTHDPGKTDSFSPSTQLPLSTIHENK